MPGEERFIMTQKAKKEEQYSASKWLNRKLSEAKKQYIYALLFTLSSAAAYIGFSWFLSRFAAFWTESARIEIKLLGIAACFLGGRYFFAHFALIFNYNAGDKIVSRLKSEAYPKLLHNNELDTASSTLYLTKMADDLKPYYTSFISNAMAAVTVSLLIFCVCLFIDGWVAFILIVSFLVIPLQMIIVGIGTETLHLKHIGLFLKYSSVFYNRLQTIAEIVNLDNFKQQHRFLEKKGEELNEASGKVMQVAMLSSAILELFVTISIAVIAIYLGMSLLGIIPGVTYGKGYDFGNSLFMLTLSPYFFFYLRKFVSAYHDRNRAIASVKMLIPILEHEEEVVPENTDEAFRSFEIKNISFAYPDSTLKVLHNINLSFPGRGLVWVKGISGSGKSTLLKICAGNLSVWEGGISVNGKNNLQTRRWLQKNSSYMNQFPFIFDGNLRYNVFLNSDLNENSGYPDFLDKLLSKKPSGWDFALTHNGKQLSGGEKQLVTLARSIMHPRPLVILDEPTANLDSETAHIILSVITRMAKEKLVIVASHEPLFGGIADKILSLNWGEQMEENE